MPNVFSTDHQARNLDSKTSPWSKYKDEMILLSLLGLLIVGLGLTLIATGVFAPLGITFLALFSEVVSSFICGIAILAVAVAIGGLIGVLIHLQLERFHEGQSSFNDEMELNVGETDLPREKSSFQVVRGEHPGYTSIFRLPKPSKSSDPDDELQSIVPTSVSM